MPKVVKGKTGSRPDKNRDRPIHPYSRKAKKLGKQVQHYKKVETAKNARVARLETVAEKLRWFQDHIDDRVAYTQEDLVDLVLLYRNRFEEELEQINIVNSVGKRPTQSRQHASREAAIRITKEDEKNQYEGSGIEAPDIVSREHLENLKNWKGELNLIQNLKMVKVSAQGVSGLKLSISKSKQLNNSEKVLDLDNENMSDNGSTE